MTQQSEFHKYFLDAQERAEVYVGSDVAAVFYEDGAVAVSGTYGRFSWFVLEPYELDGLESVIAQIRKPEFLRGVFPEIDRPLQRLMAEQSYVEQASHALCQQAALDSDLAYVAEDGFVEYYEDAFNEE